MLQKHIAKKNIRSTPDCLINRQYAIAVITEKTDVAQKLWEAFPRKAAVSRFSEKAPWYSHI